MKIIVLFNSCHYYNFLILTNIIVIFVVSINMSVTHTAIENLLGMRNYSKGLSPSLGNSFLQ